MDSPLSAILMLTATTGGWFGNLSDNKKGIVALIGAVVFGFSVGTVTIAQVGLPQRVEALELIVNAHDGLESRVARLEDAHRDAQRELSYLLRAIQWQNCALEAQNDNEDMRGTCGLRPQWAPRQGSLDEGLLYYE